MGKDSREWRRAPSPIADPMVEAMFASAEGAGLAAQSLFGGRFAEDGEPFGTVVWMKTQDAFTLPGERGCRVDITARTDRDEVVLGEVQVLADKTLLDRDLFEAARAHTAHKGGLPVREVVEMGTPGLREFAAMDKGFQQFLSQYDYAANDPEVRRKYQDWYIELWRRQENERAAEERGVAIGEERGEKRGEERGIAFGEERRGFAIARNMLRDGEPVEKIMRYTGLTLAEVKGIDAT
jgi:hypothetical protein